MSASDRVRVVLSNSAQAGFLRVLADHLDRWDVGVVNVSSHTDLDQWIKSGLDAELTQMDAAFDFEAGLADIYARAGLTRPEATKPHSQTATGTPPARGRVSPTTGK